MGPPLVSGNFTKALTIHRRQSKRRIWPTRQLRQIRLFQFRSRTQDLTRWVVLVPAELGLRVRPPVVLPVELEPRVRHPVVVPAKPELRVLRVRPPVVLPEEL